MESPDGNTHRTGATGAPQTRRPESTYRLQFHAGFTFRDAAAVVPYLHDLGVTDCYASPYLKARPGSTHGYDVIDHSSLNPELGGEADYDRLHWMLRSGGVNVSHHDGVAKLSARN